jgi:uncharacterized membrane protein HdeD (DUF308 family)
MMRLNNRARTIKGSQGWEKESTWISINIVGFCFSFVSFFTQPLVFILILSIILSFDLIIRGGVHP